MNEYQVINGDCREAMKSLADCSVDSVVTDPPYELGFMGKKWDGTGIAYDVYVWAECLRVLKPGGYLLAFGGSRTYHRLACAIEDAGFEIRDQIQWIYGSGFPKSLDVSKAIDAAAGVDRVVIGSSKYANRGRRIDNSVFGQSTASQSETTTIPETVEAKQWDGWGTALKPAHEILTHAQKPYDLAGHCTILAQKIRSVLCQLSSSVKDAEQSFPSSLRGFAVDADSTLWLAVSECNTLADLYDLMATLPCASEIPLSLNIALSWLNILADLSSAASTFTTEMNSSLTTDLKTLNCLPLQITPDFIIEAAMSRLGMKSSVSPVDSILCAAKSKLDYTLNASAPESATSKAHTLRRAEVENNSIVLARKPLSEKTVAANVLKWGTGGINVDGCRIETQENLNGGTYSPDGKAAPMPGDERTGAALGMFAPGARPKSDYKQPTGRFPANVITDGSDEVLAGFPESEVSGAARLGRPAEAVNRGMFSASGMSGNGELHNDSGSAARFFYQAKADKEDRNDGLDDLAVRSAGDVTDRKDGSDGLNSPRAGAGRTNGSRNSHPTVKPTDLMRYLCRLVTPPNGTVLDPFTGSGSTGRGAVLEGLRFIGIELDAEYCELAERRIAAATRQGLLAFNEPANTRDSIPTQEEFFASSL